MKTLSLCMITKNEEKNISRCLDSIKDIVDEIIIVDTGSTDKTIEIAKSYGANIYHYKWNNDFSKARNVSLQKATKDWILVLDADEVLPYEEGLKLKNIINTTENEGLFLRLDNIIDNVNLGDAVVLRAFKNNPKYRFRGSMHEQVIFSIEEVSGKNKIQPTNVKITHYGYDPNVCDMEEKQKRNLSILESYPEEDRDGYFYYSLGNEYSRIKEYDKALKIISYENHHKFLVVDRNFNKCRICSALIFKGLGSIKTMISEEKENQNVPNNNNSMINKTRTKTKSRSKRQLIAQLMNEKAQEDANNFGFAFSIQKVNFNNDNDIQKFESNLKPKSNYIEKQRIKGIPYRQVQHKVKKVETIVARNKEPNTNVIGNTFQVKKMPIMNSRPARIEHDHKVQLSPLLIDL